MELTGRKVAVLGGGTSGFCAARLAQAKGAEVTGFDSGPTEKLAPAIERFAEIGIELITGEAALQPSSKYDITVISPGIDASWPLAQALVKVSNELIGEIELAWRLSDIPVVAITGTNGKTTTTELITHLFNESGKKAIAAGNYGYAYSDVVYYGEQYDWVVLEVSSFQLETIHQFRPQISVWMNFAADHMDRYQSLSDYKNAKLRIFENQTSDDLAIIKLEENLEVAPQTTTFSAFQTGGDFGYADKQIIDHSGTALIDFSKTRLNGKHNAENVMAALAVMQAAGISNSDQTEQAVQSYQPPAHRCEVVGEKNGVIFVNDSKATNLHALESALRGQDSKVTLIVGGKDKGLDFSELNDLISNHVHIAISIGEIGQQIADKWNGLVPCKTADSLESAVELAYENRASTEVILFSPGTSSFDMFSGYEARGDCFKAAVKRLVSG